MKFVLRFLVSFPKVILSALFCLSIIFGFYATKLSVDASSETLMLDHDKDLDIWRQISNKYVSPNFLVVAYTPKTDLFDTENLELIKSISLKLEKNDLVSSVTSILNVPLLQSVNGGVVSILNHTPTLEDKDINKSKVKKEFLTSKIYSQNLISKDLKTTAIVLNLKTDFNYIKLLNSRNELLLKHDLNRTNDKILDELNIVKDRLKKYRDIQRVKEHKNLEDIKSIISSYNTPTNKLFLGGANMIADDMVSYVKSDIVVYGLSVAFLLALSMWIFFRQFIWVVLPIFICCINVMFSMGTFGIFGWEITVVSSNFIALVLIISMSIVMHLIVSYKEHYNLRPSYTQKQLVYVTLRDKLNPSFWAVFTTIVGFISLTTADIKPVIMLGIMMSVGILISFILAFIVFGSVLSCMNKIKSLKTKSLKLSLTSFCCNLALRDKKAIFFVSFIAICFGIYGVSKLRVENSFIGYFKQDTEIYQGMKVIDDKLGGTIPLDVIIKFKPKSKPKQDFFDEFESEFGANADDDKYWFNSYHTRIAKKVHNYLLNQKFVGYVGSLATLLYGIEDVNNGKIDDFLLAAMYEKLPEKYKDILLNPYVNLDDDELRFSLRVVDSNKSLRRDVFIKNLEAGLKELTKDDNVDVKVAGIMVLYNNVLQNLVTSQIDTFGLSIFTLFILFCFVFRSLKMALIAIGANIVPLCIVFGLMGFLKIPLDVMSITIAAISIGIGVDDIIHYIHRFLHERRTKTVQKSIEDSHSSIGHAMYYTSFAIMLGFSVMMSSNFVPTIYFGLLTNLAMVLMLLSALIFLPRLILLFYKD